jgi:hypothetical protein
MRKIYDRTYIPIREDHFIDSLRGDPDQNQVVVVVGLEVPCREIGLFQVDQVAREGVSRLKTSREYYKVNTV